MSLVCRTRSLYLVTVGLLAGATHGASPPPLLSSQEVLGRIESVDSVSSPEQLPHLMLRRS